jgi:hypothetical protein
LAVGLLGEAVSEVVHQLSMSQAAKRAFDDPAADAGELLVRIGLTVLAILVPVSVILSRRALFTLVPVGASLVVLGGILIPHVSLRQRLKPMLLSVPGLSGIALIAWCALSLIWTPFPVDAAERLWKSGGTLALIVLTVAVLPERSRTSNLYLFPIGLAAASILTAVAMVLQPQIFLAIQPEDSTPERAAISLVILVWPAIGALAVRDRWVAAAALAVVTMIAALAAWTSVALAALAVGALAFTAATWHPPRVARFMGILAIVLFLAAPAVALALAPSFAALTAKLGTTVPALLEVNASVQTWAAVTTAEPLRLITGHGFDISGRAIATEFIPSPAPRSILFEVWYELGIVGAAAYAILAGGAFLAVGRSSTTVAPFLLAELAAGSTVALWGADTTQLWWITSLGVGAVAFVHVIRGQYRTDRPAVPVLRSAAQ